MEITREQFEAYEEVRVSTVTNMLDVKTVCKRTGLNPVEAVYIVTHYGELRDKFQISS